MKLSVSAQQLNLIVICTYEAVVMSRSVDSKYRRPPLKLENVALKGKFNVR